MTIRKFRIHKRKESKVQIRARRILRRNPPGFYGFPPVTDEPGRIEK